MPFFILSCERSGSTLLRFLLDTHPEVAAPGELGLGELCHRLILVQSRTLGQQREQPISVVPTWWQSDECVTPETEEFLNTTRRIVSSIMQPYTAAEGKKHWCAKAPSNLPFCNLLRLTFPEAKFLCLYRHGLDVAHSCLEISKHGFMKELKPYLLASPGDTVKAMLRSWADKTTNLYQFQNRFPKQCLGVRYEDLVLNTESTVSEILEFLALEPAPQLCEKALTVSHHKGGGDPKIWGTTNVHSDRIGCGAGLPVSHLPQALTAKVDELLRKLNYQETIHANC